MWRGSALVIRDADAVVEKVMFCARPDSLDTRAAKVRFIDPHHSGTGSTVLPLGFWSDKEYPEALRLPITKPFIPGHPGAEVRSRR
jgi:hypothetical protein